MNSPLDPGQAGAAGQEPDPGDEKLIPWLRANPKPVSTAALAAVTVITGIAAVIATDTPVGKAVGGILFLLVATVGFFGNWLWGHVSSRQAWIDILSALALAAAAGVFMWAAAPIRVIDITHVITVPAPATITIDQPTPGALVGPRPDISGTVTHLGAGQYVWMFSQPYSISQPYEPLPGIGPYEQCEIADNRTQFTCPQAFDGSVNSDYCRMALLWVSVVDGRQLNDLRVVAQQGDSFPKTWPNPPISGDSSGYVLVQRKPEPGHACSNS